MSEKITLSGHINFYTEEAGFFKSIFHNGNICSKHKTPHVSKVASGILINAFLYQETQDSVYKKQAEDQILWTINYMGDSIETYLARAAKNRAKNLSSNAIDIGTLVFVFSKIVNEYSQYFSFELISQLRTHLIAFADGYLKDSIYYKKHVNQRLWGAYGLAHAYNVVRNEAWKKVVISTVRDCLKEMKDDGCFVYYDRAKELGHFPGADELSPNYQSRNIFFAARALELVNSLDAELLDRLQKSVNCLLALCQPNGVKPLNLETKRWYFLSSYDISSNSFDVAALLTMYRHTGDVRLKQMAEKSFAQMKSHQAGRLLPHKDKVQNFICDSFVNAHTVYVLDCFEDSPGPGFNEVSSPKSDPLQILSTTQLVNYSGENYACILRGQKKSTAALWGPMVGGGSIVYFGRNDTGFSDAFISEPAVQRAGNFIVSSGLSTFQKNYFKKREIRAVINYVLIELKNLNLREAFYRLYLYGQFIYNSTFFYASQFYTSPIMTADKEKRQVTFETGLAKLDGTILEGINLTRSYWFSSEKLHVAEHLTVSRKEPISFKYILPKKAEEIKIDFVQEQLKISPSIKFHLATGEIKISYSL